MKLKFSSLFLWGLMSFSCVSAQKTRNDLKIDHVLIAVECLDSAVRQYESYGFKVVYGGSEKKALNALIFLKDGTLIELIGQDRFPLAYKLLNSARATLLFGRMKDRITSFPNVPAGFFNYCLYSNDIDEYYLYLKRQGIKVDKAKRFRRKREDGVTIQWELLGTSPYDLPFIISDYTPQRLTDSSYTIHSNNAIGIGSIIVETSDFTSYYNHYCVLYQQKPEIKIKNNERCSEFSVGSSAIVLTESNNHKVYFSKRDKSCTSFFIIKCSKQNQTLSKKYQGEKQLPVFLLLTYLH